MDLAALNLCSIITQARFTRQPGVAWNVRFIHCLTLVAVNNIICQVNNMSQRKIVTDYKKKSNV